VVGAIGFATATGASAQTIAEAVGQSDLLMISETPLTSSELGEARGGFVFGGFDFKFGVEIAPVSITNPLPDGGVFGESGVFGDEGGPIGESGVFGEGGVFGANNGPADNSAAVTSQSNQPQTPQQQVASVTPAPSSPSTTSTLPAVTSTASPVPSSASTPIATASQSVNTPAQDVIVVASAELPQSSPVPAATPATPIPAQNAPAPSSVAPASSAPIQQPGPLNTGPAPTAAPSPSNSETGPVGSPLVVQQVPDTPKPAAGNKISLAEPQKPNPSNSPTNMPFSTNGDIIQRIIYTTGPNGRTFTIDNNVNGAIIYNTTNINVRIENFDSRINSAIADTVTAAIASSYGFLGSLNN
jgi:hypothetical protein